MPALLQDEGYPKQKRVKAHGFFIAVLLAVGAILVENGGNQFLKWLFSL